MASVKIATFNVNSVKARMPRVLEWLRNSAPDIILLQELKCVEEVFPFSEFFDAGYNAVVSGQKSYNGVAILAKSKIEDVVKGLPELGGDPDEQARYIEGLVTLHGKVIRVASIYVPNGGGDLMPGETLEESKKFTYKLHFFERLKAHFSNLLALDEMQIFGGDFNVALDDIDVYDAKYLNGTVCFHPLERRHFRSILNLGLVDSYRAKNPASQCFSWYDYRGGSWQNGKGMRIDYLLTSPLAADKITNASIEDKGVRDLEKASDHCPCIVEIELN